MKTNLAATPNGFAPSQTTKNVKSDIARNVGIYGSRELSHEILAVCRQPIDLPEIDKQYVMAIAKSRGRNGEQDIRDFSGRQFGHENAELEGQTRHLEVVVNLETAGAERHCKENSAKLALTPPTIIHHREGQPATLLSRITIGILVAISVLGLLMGINSTATVLMSSGIAGFESPFRAYCYSMVPILLAIVIKIFGTIIEKQSQRHLYTYGVCGLAIFLGIVWAASFAKTFPGMTQSVVDVIQSVANSDPANASSGGSGWMIFISIMAEAFGASACWLVIQIICERHQKTIVETNPEYEALQKEQDAWCKRRNENRRLAGQLSGKLNALSDARRHFVEDCVGHFHAALKIVADNEDLKGFLTD